MNITVLTNLYAALDFSGEKGLQIATAIFLGLELSGFEIAEDAAYEPLEIPTGPIEVPRAGSEGTRTRNR